MTVSELCSIFSTGMRDALYNLPEGEVEEELFKGVTDEMTAPQIYAKMMMNAMVLSADLTIQSVIFGLVEMGVISKSAISMKELKPKIRLVRPVQKADSSHQKEGEVIYEDKIKKFKRDNC